MKCPICDKVGLADGTLECPQCNSDLSQFGLLDRLEENSVTSRKRRTVLSVIVAILLVSTLILVFRLNTISEIRKEKIDNQHKDDFSNVAESKDSTLFYKAKLSLALHTVDSLTELSKTVTINYIVNSGDNLLKIAFQFYRNYEKVQEIVENNNLKDPNMIFRDQVIKIEIELTK